MIVTSEHLSALYMITLWLLKPSMIHSKTKGEIMMKDKYISPEMEIIEFKAEDVITTSQIGDLQTPQLH